MKRLLARIAAAALMASTFGLGSALAGSIELSPVSLQMVGKERTTTLRVRNTEAQPITLQLRSVDWTQQNGEDVYTPSKTLAVSPPVFTLQPGETQTVRVVVEKVDAFKVEKAYRLILDQIPASSLHGQAGVVVPIRVLLPVFLTPSSASRPRLSWALASSPSGRALTASNSGDARERLVSLKVTSGTTQVAGEEGLSGYVLAGSTRSFPLKGSIAPSAKISVSGEGIFTPIKADLAP
ncbi:MAG: molecular chaperone [Caulobacter sp.]|nr:molecular chaperone [Caulobacter sp.]